MSDTFFFLMATKTKKTSFLERLTVYFTSYNSVYSNVNNLQVLVSSKLLPVSFCVISTVLSFNIFLFYVLW